MFGVKIAAVDKRQRGAHPTEGYKWISAPKLPKLDLIADAEHFANLANVSHSFIFVY